MRKLLFVYIIFSYLSYSQQPVYYPGFPKIIYGEDPFLVSGIPLITDLEKDGQKEIIFVSVTSSFDYLHVIKSDGNELTGFPKAFTGVITAYASGDVDNNGTLDIAIRTALAQGQIIVIDRFGNNLPGFPVPYSDDNNNLAPTLSIYDLDGDGKLEIIVNRVNEVCVFQHNGTIRTGWPRTVAGATNAFPAIGDVDRDGFAEIIVFTSKTVSSGSDSSALHLFRHNGNYYSSNWPVYYDSSYLSFASSPTLYIDKSNIDSTFILISQTSDSLMRVRNVSYNLNGQITRRAYIENQQSRYGSIIPSDINRDYFFEFVNGKHGNQYDTSLFLYNHSFQVLPNWPRVGVSHYRSTAVIGRFTYSNELNIVAHTWSTGEPIGYGYIYGYKYNGEQLPWSPLRPEGLVKAISAGDINNDGSVELIAISQRYMNETRIHIWTFPNVPFSYEDFPWPQFGHDRYRTNQYGFLPPDEPIGIQPINSNIPVSFRLHQNYPNPFNPFTNIRFDLPRESYVRLVIYDILGRVVSVLADEKLKAGEYRVNWDATKYSSGIYFYRLTADGYSETRKMIVSK